MSNNFFFPTFYFHPVKLDTAVQELKKKYPYGDQISDNIIKRKLPDLLARIRLLANNETELTIFAKELKSIDINILSSAYPYETENEITKEKIIFILSIKYNSIVGRRFWNHFQHRFTDEKVSQILSHAFQNEEENFLGLKHPVKEKYEEIFKSIQPDQVLNDLATSIGRENKFIEESFKDYKIIENNQLSNELWLRILNLFMKVPDFINNQGETQIVEKLKNLYLDHYKSIILTYLEAYDYMDYHPMLFTQVIERLKDPREDMKHWEDVSEHVKQKVRMYLNEKDLHDFFTRENDHGRFNYWKKYIRGIEDTNFITEPPIAAMYFKNFVVVEFAKTGNAAYFYEREGFDKHLVQKMKIYMKEDTLKDTHAAYFISKLNHSGYWWSRYDKYMANYLQGYFHYSHRY